MNISPVHIRAELEAGLGGGERAPREEVAFHPSAKRVLELALHEARLLGHNYIGTEHLLLGLIHEGTGVAASVLKAIGAEINRVRLQVIYLLGEEKTTPYKPEPTPQNAVAAAISPAQGRFSAGVGAPGPAAYVPVPFTPAALQAMARALQEAVRQGHASVGDGHLLLGLIRDDQGLATRSLLALGVDLHDLRQTTELLVQEHGGAG